MGKKAVVVDVAREDCVRNDALKVEWSRTHDVQEVQLRLDYYLEQHTKVRLPLLP